MKNHDFNTITVADGTEMELYTAFPDGAGPFPAIIVLQEAFGVTAHIRKVAEGYCKEGYAVVSPDLFHRKERRVEIAYEDMVRVMPFIQAAAPEGIIADLKAAYSFLQQQQQVLINKIGSVGYCMGGRIAFLANAVLPLSAAVSYYGGLPVNLEENAALLHGAQLFFWGGLDKHIPQETIDKVISAVKGAGKEYTNVVISYADHGFNCDDRAAYHPFAAKEALAHTLAFFENRLK